MQRFISRLDNIGGKKMPRFDKNHMEDLKMFIYNGYDHDSKLEKVRYDCEKDIMIIKLFNPIFNVKIIYTFYNIEMTLAMKGNEYGCRETIISLTVEENTQYLQNYLKNCENYNENFIYLVFQMFSGDELHIVSKEVSIEIVE